MRKPRFDKNLVLIVLIIFPWVLWFCLTMLRLIIHVYLLSIFYLVNLAMFGLFVIFFFLSLFVWLVFHINSTCLIMVLMCFLFSYCVTFNMMCVLFYLSAWCMFRLRIGALLITSLFKYGLTTYNGDQPTSRTVLDA